MSFLFSTSYARVLYIECIGVRWECMPMGISISWVVSL